MIISLMKIYPAQGHASGIIDVFQSVKVLLAPVPDCLHVAVSTESGENGAIFYLEKWRSSEAFVEHLRSSTYMMVLEALEFSCRNPEVTFFDGVEVGGLDVVERARSLSSSGI
ncbi:MAG: antibiotic biosynthesis monooxygenase family protein [Desulfomicrobium sp.]